MSDKNVLDFLAEAGMLKRVKRSGWWMVGIPYDESVAEHSFRCAAVGYILAKMENAEPYKVLMMTLFNDLHEARTGDLHKVAHGYLNVREGESKAFAGQIENLEKGMKEELKRIKEEYDAQETLESRVARDADILECLLQAKEYVDIGFPNAEKFFKAAPGHLRTESARRLWESAKPWDSSAWWGELGKFER